MALGITGNSATIGTTEYSIPAATTSGVPTSQTDDCVLQCWIDLGAMAAGDSFQVKVYEKVNGGTQRTVYVATLVGAQTDAAFVLPSLFLGEGWDVTLKKIAGTDRSIGWSLRKVT